MKDIVRPARPPITLSAVCLRSDHAYIPLDVSSSPCAGKMSNSTAFGGIANIRPLPHDCNWHTANEMQKNGFNWLF